MKQKFWTKNCFGDAFDDKTGIPLINYILDNIWVESPVQTSRPVLIVGRNRTALTVSAFRSFHSSHCSRVRKMRNSCRKSNFSAFVSLMSLSGDLHKTGIDRLCLTLWPESVSDRWPQLEDEISRFKSCCEQRFSVFGIYLFIYSLNK